MMTMLRLKRAQRAVVVDKIPDFANVAAAALVFGQAFSDQAFSGWLAVLGLTIWIVVMTLAVVVAAEESEP